MTKAKAGSARAGAVALLNAVLGEGALLAQALDTPGFAGLPPAEKARAQRLAGAVLRAVEPADKVLKPLMRKAPPLPVLNILRLAVVELSGGAAAHGVVNEAVGLARASRKTGHLSGLVNAVLRQVPEGVALTPVQKMPRWLRQPLVHAYGREAVTAMEAVQAAAPPLDLTVRAGAEAPEGETLPTGSLRLGRGLRGRVLLRELLADVGQHDGRQDRQQLLDQLAVARATARQRRRDLAAVVAAEDLRDGVGALVLVDLVDRHATVEESARRVAGGLVLDAGRGIGVFRVVLQAAHQQRHQLLYGAVHLPFISAELGRNLLCRNLIEQFVKTSHGFPPHVPGMCVKPRRRH